jgi:hypothetical protein
MVYCVSPLKVMQHLEKKTAAAAFIALVPMKLLILHTLYWKFKKFTMTLTCQLSLMCLTTILIMNHTMSLTIPIIQPSLWRVNFVKVRTQQPASLSLLVRPT